MARMTDQEIAGLAKLVSDNAEADGNGRTLAALDRRMEVSGGQLKAIFMAGAESAGAQSGLAAEQAAQIERLHGELDALREALRRTEAAGRSAVRERDSLRVEAEQLQAALDGRRSARLGRAAMYLVVLLALGGTGWLAYHGPKLRVFGSEQDAAGTPFYRSAVVRDGATALRREPDIAAPPVTTLAAGTHLLVRQVMWHNLLQWVEVQVGSDVGYVLSTEVELS